MRAAPGDSFLFLFGKIFVEKVITLGQAFSLFGLELSVTKRVSVYIRVS